MDAKGQQLLPRALDEEEAVLRPISQQPAQIDRVGLTNLRQQLGKSRLVKLA